MRALSLERVEQPWEARMCCVVLVQVLAQPPPERQRGDQRADHLRAAPRMHTRCRECAQKFMGWTGAEGMGGKDGAEASHGTHPVNSGRADLLDGWPPPRRILSYPPLQRATLGRRRKTRPALPGAHLPHDRRGLAQPLLPLDLQPFAAPKIARRVRQVRHRTHERGQRVGGKGVPEGDGGEGGEHYPAERARAKRERGRLRATGREPKYVERNCAKKLLPVDFCGPLMPDADAARGRTGESAQSRGAAEQTAGGRAGAHGGAADEAKGRGEEEEGKDGRRDGDGRDAVQRFEEEQKVEQEPLRPRDRPVEDLRRAIAGRRHIRAKTWAGCERQHMRSTIYGVGCSAQLRRSCTQHCTATGGASASSEHRRRQARAHASLWLRCLERSSNSKRKP